MSATPYDVIRPFAILAVIAFVLGFVGYVALGRPALVASGLADPPAMAAEPAADATAGPAAAASPASDDWNLPKKI